MEFGGNRTTYESDCRQCTSFDDFLKANANFSGNKQRPPRTVQERAELRRTDCPLDKDQLGSCSWSLLHTIASKYPDSPNARQKRDMEEFLTLFSKLYPCAHCAKDFQQDLKMYRPQLESQEALSRWLCEMHNRVNVKIGKQPFDCRLVQQRWRDGWPDGSCNF